MARIITPLDAYALMNTLVREATGQANNIEVVDISSFVSAGESVLATGMENVVNSLNIVLGRTLVAARPYNAKLKLMQALDTGIYTNRLRKISYYAQDALPDGGHNTQYYTNLAQGFTAGDNGGSSTKSQWEQHQPMPLEMNFAGSSVWQDCITMYDDQLQVAFRGPEEFARFVTGYLTEHGSDIESQKEAWNRMALLNRVASTYVYNNPGSVVNLTFAFNERFGTDYTSSELRSTYLKEFLAFFVSEFKKVSKFMTERSAYYHNPMTLVDDNNVRFSILRHTPYDRQHVYLYSPLFTEAEALVLPEIFRPNYLDIDKQYEEVTYWQSITDRARIDVMPALYDKTSPGDRVSIPYVVGMITDEDGLMTNFQMERSDSTPLEARKHYRNVWNTFQKNIIDDPTENCVIFIMKDNELSPSPSPT